MMGRCHEAAFPEGGLRGWGRTPSGWGLQGAGADSVTLPGLILPSHVLVLRTARSFQLCVQTVLVGTHGIAAGTPRLPGIAYPFVAILHPLLFSLAPQAAAHGPRPPDPRPPRSPANPATSAPPCTPSTTRASALPPAVPTRR